MTADGALCRDCLAAAPPGSRRCPACGSPRVLDHADLHRLAIAHVDCDAFYAAIEKRDDPSLADRPVIVGGGRRGVVATACYIARIHGVRSAMPMFKALRLCPEAVVIRPNMEKYVAVGRQVRALMLDLTPLVEPVSIDEAFLDLSGTEAVHGASPAVSMARFQARVEREIGITVSVGLAPNKFLAKLASDRDKPRGFTVIGRGEAEGFLRDAPVALLWGVGAASAAALERAGYRKVGDIAAAEPAAFIRRYGSLGERLLRLARGEDSRPVNPEREAKSVSAETTFEEDESRFEVLEPRLRRLAEKVSARCKRAGLGGRTVTLKLKTADFRLVTRSRTLADPTQLADRIHRAAADLLRREVGGRRFRLIGVGVSELHPGSVCDPPALVDEGAGRRAAAERAMDAVRGKFGNAAVELGLTFAARPAAEDGDQGQGLRSSGAKSVSRPSKAKSP